MGHSPCSTMHLFSYDLQSYSWFFIPQTIQEVHIFVWLDSKTTLWLRMFTILEKVSRSLSVLLTESFPNSWLFLVTPQYSVISIPWMDGYPQCLISWKIASFSWHWKSWTSLSTTVQFSLKLPLSWNIFRNGWLSPELMADRNSFLTIFIVLTTYKCTWLYPTHLTTDFVTSELLRYG